MYNNKGNVSFTSLKNNHDLNQYKKIKSVFSISVMFYRRVHSSSCGDLRLRDSAMKQG